MEDLKILHKEQIARNSVRVSWPALVELHSPLSMIASWTPGFSLTKYLPLAALEQTSILLTAFSLVISAKVLMMPHWKIERHAPNKIAISHEFGVAAITHYKYTHQPRQAGGPSAVHM